MTQAEPAAELNEGFSEPGAAARPWAEVAAVLSHAEMFWLSTVRRDGRPHVTPLPAIWLDGVLYFCAGSHEQKATSSASSRPRSSRSASAPTARPATASPPETAAWPGADQPDKAGKSARYLVLVPRGTDSAVVTPSLVSKRRESVCTHSSASRPSSSYLNVWITSHSTCWPWARPARRWRSDRGQAGCQR